MKVGASTGPVSNAVEWVSCQSFLQRKKKNMNKILLQEKGTEIFIAP